MRSTWWNNNEKLIKFLLLFFNINIFDSTQFFSLLLWIIKLFFLKYHIISTYYLIYIDIFFILFTLWNSNMKNIYNMVLFFIIQSYINSIYLNFHSYTMINFQYNLFFYYIFISLRNLQYHWKFFIFSQNYKI